MSNVATPAAGERDVHSDKPSHGDVSDRSNPPKREGNDPNFRQVPRGMPAPPLMG
jgi:hypothetical protein